MRHYWKLLAVVLLLSALLCGCKRQAAPLEEPLVFVTQIHIDYEYRQNHLLRSYTDADKMDVILYYLYGLSPHGQPEEDPEQIQGDSCKITVTLSNGQQKIYRQIGSQYLSVDFHPWQTIPQDRGSLLYHLVNHIESDI